MNDVIKFPKKMRAQLFQAGVHFMQSVEGIYKQEDVFEVIRNEARKLPQDILFDEACKSIGKSAINSQTTPKLSGNEDWIGYGNMVISLPDTKLVNVRYAGFDALDIRKAHVIENRDRIVKASNEEIKRIDVIQELMIKIQVDIAGPALKILAMKKAA